MQYEAKLYYVSFGFLVNDYLFIEHVDGLIEVGTNDGEFRVCWFRGKVQDFMSNAEYLGTL